MIDQNLEMIGGQQESVTVDAKKIDQVNPSQDKISVKKRDQKKQDKTIQSEFRLRNQVSGPTLWHCCLELKNGGHCPSPIFDSTQIWKHIRTKKHAKTDYKTEEGIP